MGVGTGEEREWRRKRIVKKERERERVMGWEFVEER
jgi:hypothetical protein